MLLSCSGVSEPTGLISGTPAIFSSVRICYESHKWMDGEPLKGCLMVRMDPGVGARINTLIWYGKVNGPWVNKKKKKKTQQGCSLSNNQSGFIS